MGYQNLDLDQSAKYNMIVAKDRTLNTIITAEYNDPVSGVTPFDFATYTGATLQVKSKPESSTIILEFNMDDSSIELFQDGKFKLFKEAIDMNVRAGDYYYDMYLSSEIYPKRAFLSGSFKITQNISD